MHSGVALDRPVSVTSRGAWMAPVAAGIFVGALAFDALPSALGSIGGWAWVWAGAGLGLMVASSRLAQGRNSGWAAWAATLGIWFHSILEGVASGTGAGVGTGGSILLAAGLVVHLIPESVALYAVLIGSRVPAGRALGRCAVTWALVVVGYLASQQTVSDVPAAPMGLAMALAAGTFAFLAWVLWQHRGRGNGAWFGAILGVCWVAVLHLS